MFDVIPVIGYSPYAWMGLSLLITIGLMVGIMVLAWWMNRQSDQAPCPYTGKPLRRLMELPYSSLVKIYQFMSDYPGYDNRIFRFPWASYCRETGRIFPSSVTWTGKIKVDWSFLQKRHKGQYVSWGSLSPEQKEEIYRVHHDLDGFQTEHSSPNPSPIQIEPPYVYHKPGPLYVDLETKTLLGWKCVTNSDLEVLIVQKPKPPGSF